MRFGCTKGNRNRDVSKFLVAMFSFANTTTFFKPREITANGMNSNHISLAFDNTKLKATDSSKECVKVAVRCRPLNDREKTEKSSVILDILQAQASVSIRNPDSPNEPPKQFTFDAAFDSNASQIQIYQSTAQQIVEAVLDGYNGTVFAYGTVTDTAN